MVGGWDEGVDLGDGSGETRTGGGFVGVVDEPGAEVALVGGVELGEVFGGGVELIEVPLSGVGVEPGEAAEGELRRTLRKDELEALVEAATGGLLPAGLEPEDTQSEDAVDGGLRLLLVDGNDGEGLVAFDERPTGVGGAEGLFEVHGGAEGVWLVVREVAL